MAILRQVQRPSGSGRTDFSGSRKNGSSSSRTSTATDRIIWVFPRRNAFTRTIASRSGTTTIRRARVSRRWPSHSRATLGASMAAASRVTGAPSQDKSSFVGWMLYDRMWFHKDKLGLTLGGGEMSNYGRYLTLAAADQRGRRRIGSRLTSRRTPGQKAHMWDSTVTLQYMPKQYITWWAEVGYRHSDVPYFAGRGGVTPPVPWKYNGSPADVRLRRRRRRQGQAISPQRKRPVAEDPVASGSRTFAVAKRRSPSA